MALSGEVAVALSGGGVRALLYGLGALRAVVDGLDDHRRLRVVAGVSGGGVGAAFAASRLDLAASTRGTYDDEVLKPAFHTITRRSVMFATWHLWAVIAALVIALLAAVAFATIGLGLPPWGQVMGTVAMLLLAVVIFGWRGAATERAFIATLFPSKPRLADLQDHGARLVLTATDLGSGEATYLTSRGIVSFRWGEAPCGDLSLARAARATATFPIVFPALHLGGLRFTGGREQAPKKLALVDGGVYDNMGSEWLFNSRRTSAGTYLIVVNASRNLGVRGSGYGTFGVGEIRVLLREKDIQYDATTAPRRRWLHQLFTSGGADGTIVRIDGNIREWVEAFADARFGDKIGDRARGILAALDAAPAAAEVLSRWETANPSVMTSFNKLKPGTAADLIRAGYLATAIQLHVLADWPEPESVDPDKLSPWVHEV
jgi:predicted acylesterase/phospholipase RssA